jgi:hypothetical protein
VITLGGFHSIFILKACKNNDILFYLKNDFKNTLKRVESNVFFKVLNKIGDPLTNMSLMWPLKPNELPTPELDRIVC